jgi:predicted enzyme related to lactoylglutathione lyase
MADTKNTTLGTFCWHEVATTDPAAAKTFYQGLFGWTAKDVPMGPMGAYTMFQIRGTDTTGLLQLRPEIVKQGIRPHWLSYVAVASVDATAARAKELGAQVMGPPMDVGEFGRMALIVDPTGAAVAAWQAKGTGSAAIAGEVNAPMWTELMTRNTDVAAGFYGKLFGWKPELKQFGPMQYTQFSLGETAVAGMMEIPKDMPEVPPHWLVYLGVADCDNAIVRATALGAKLGLGPRDIPGIGRVAIFQDPQGATFAMIDDRK